MGLGNYFFDECDRQTWLKVLGLACKRFNFDGYAYCHQALLGDAAFVERHGERLRATNIAAIPKAQWRVAALTLHDYERTYSDRAEAMFQAYNSTAFSMPEIGKHFGVSDKTVSRAVHHYEKAPA